MSFSKSNSKSEFQISNNNSNLKPKNIDFENPCAAGVSRDFSKEKADNDRKNVPFYFLNIFKPRGITSFDVIYKLRKCLNIKKIGHSGTLDPLACGVMQVAVGKATRLLDYLGSDKKYVAKMRFGYFSSTLDAEGDITFFNIPNFTRDDLLYALKSLTGEIEQAPPLYSAVKVGGKKLCDLARKNKAKKTYFLNDASENSPESLGSSAMQLSQNASQIENLKNDDFLSETIVSDDIEPVSSCLNPSNTSNFTGQNFENPSYMPDLDVLLSQAKPSGVEIPKRVVKIYEANLLNFVTYSVPDDIKTNFTSEKPPIIEAEIEISCSKGTYIRSFALDLAKKLGTSAYLTSLVRTKAGNFDIKNSITLDEINPAEHAINPLLALDLPVYELNKEEYKKVLNGISFPPKASIPSDSSIMLIFKNNLVSIGVLSDNMVVCKKVFK